MMLAAVTHVVVDRSVWPPDSGWAIFAAWASAGAAIGTIVLAGFTYFMARKTADLASQTRDQVRESAAAIEQAERHHRESLSPYLKISLSALKSTEGPPVRDYEFSIENLGNGAATNIELRLALVGDAVDAVTQRDGLAVAGVWSHSGNAKYGCKFTPYNCLLSYHNIFGERGWLAADSSSGRNDGMAILEHVRPGQGTEEQWAKIRETFRYTKAPRTQ